MYESHMAIKVCWLSLPIKKKTFNLYYFLFGTILKYTVYTPASGIKFVCVIYT